MAQHGFNVWLIDFRCSGKSMCPRDKRGRYVNDALGGVAALKKAGATKIAVMGSSLGATTALVAGPSFDASVRVIVSASGPAYPRAIDATPPLDARAAVPKLHIPTMFLVSKDDAFDSVAETQDLYRACGARAKEIHVFDAGFGHGLQMFTGTDPAKTTPGQIVLSFLAAHLA